jgi:hypothetical protein
MTTAEGAGGVRVGIARGFVVGGPVIVPVVVEEGVDGIGFECESPDDGNLEVGRDGFIGYFAGVGSGRPVEISSGRVRVESVMWVLVR